MNYAYTYVHGIYQNMHKYRVHGFGMYCVMGHTSMLTIAACSLWYKNECVLGSVKSKEAEVRQ